MKEPTMKELRAYCKENDVIPRGDKRKKQSWLDAWRSHYEDRHGKTTDTVLNEAKRVFGFIRRAAQAETLQERTKIVSKAADGTVKILMDTYPDFTYKDGSAKSIDDRLYLTAQDKSREIYKELGKLAQQDPLMTVTYENTIEIYWTVVKTHFRPYKTKSNAKDFQRVEEQSKPENKITIDLSPLLHRAELVLAAPQEHSWMEVGCSIALVTGRRMNEIFSQKSTFEVIDKHTIAFTGQSKGKERKVKFINNEGKQEFVSLEEYTFNIPSLADTSLVINALHYLEEKGVRYDTSYSRKQVHHKNSKSLARVVKKSWLILPEDEKQTFHTFRAFYYREAMRRYQGSITDVARFAESIMGDKDSQILNYYNRFELV